MMLYFHVPFCTSHCSYCAFYSITSTSLLEQYYMTLLQEVRHTKTLHGNITTPISSIFFGGGTPSFIPAQYIATVLDQVQKEHAFAHDIEISIEANPESITQEKAKIWYEAGITRISIGCQSMIPETLTLLQRIHSVESVYRSIDILYDIGFTNISLDMIWGHCNHTTQRWLYELSLLLKFDIKHFSCYALTIEENTLLANQYSLHTSLPTEEELYNIYNAGRALLEEYGYIQYEISNFSKPGYECKHNLGYWNDIPYYGYGPSASSYNGRARYQHPASLKQWISRIQQCCEENRELPNKEIRTQEIAYTESLFLGLRQRKGVCIQYLNTYLPFPFEEYYKKQLERLCSHGFIEYDLHSLRVTPKGSLVIDSIVEQFLDIPFQ